MTEIERLRAEVDRLTARSWAHEALLLHFAHKTRTVGPWEATSVGETAADIRERARYSSLTDVQIALFVEEMQSLLQRLQDAGGVGD